MVEISDHDNYYYVKKGSNNDIVYSPYDHQPLNSENIIMEKLDPLFKQLINNHNVREHHGYYITNILTGECLNCFDFIWNGSFRDVCKHCHTARIYATSLQGYGSTEVAFLEIVKEYNEKGNVIFYNIIDQEYKVIIDPFRPSELQQINLNSLPGAPPKSAAKPRKPSKILRENNTALNLNTPSIQKRKTDQIRKAKRGNKSKVNALNELDLNISNFSMIPFTNPPTYSTTHYPSIYNSTTHFSNTHNTYFFQLHIFLQFLIHIFLQLINKMRSLI
ncbi:unnamed protein product [Rhizophagus irregularis]|nr:unnamed protein product [Rhizophagus irregularis]CAB5117269.1 unnamed protein product [Rhizophagus irregularis]